MSRRSIMATEAPWVPDSWLKGLRGQFAVALVATLVNGAIYLVPNHFPLAPPRLLELTAVDRWVPFWPPSIWLYISDYALVLGAFLLMRETDDKRRFVEAYLTLSLVGATIHWLYPTRFPRELFPLDAMAPGVTRWALFAYRWIDTAGSCLPSLHVAGSFLAALGLIQDRGWRFWPSLAWAMGIFLSTLTTKQHYVVDGLAGLTLGATIHVAFELRRRATPDYSSAARVL